MGRTRVGLLVLLLGECGVTSLAVLDTVHEELDHVYVVFGVNTNSPLTYATISVHVSKYFGTEALRSLFSDDSAPLIKCFLKSKRI